MLGSDKSSGYYLEIILHSISRYDRLLPGPQQEAFHSEINQKVS